MDSAPTLVARGAWLVHAYNRLTDTLARHGWPMQYGLTLFSTRYWRIACASHTNRTLFQSRRRPHRASRLMFRSYARL
jgi:hypothetical protein